METPDANVSEAQQFMDLVNNEHLAPHGVFARGLYNQSPSFLWDVSFFLESQEISAKVADFIHKLNDISPLLPVDQCKFLVKKFLAENGDRTRGDYRFSDEYVEQILGNGLDLARGKTSWHSQIAKQMRLLESIGPSLQSFKGKAEAERILTLGFRPLRHITNIIVAQRLKNFKDRISNAGFECLLTTLPLYPSDALTASKLARGMTETGIHDFVINQRAARKYADFTGNLTCFFHQKATGTGYEQKLNSILGNTNTSLLDGSTEAESRRQEQVLRNQGIKVGDGVLTGEW
jgi:isocitrate lyase